MSTEEYLLHGQEWFQQSGHVFVSLLPYWTTVRSTHVVRKQMTKWLYMCIFPATTVRWAQWLMRCTDITVWSEASSPHGHCYPWKSFSNVKQSRKINGNSFFTPQFVMSNSDLDTGPTVFISLWSTRATVRSTYGRWAELTLVHRANVPPCSPSEIQHMEKYVAGEKGLHG